MKRMLFLTLSVAISSSAAVRTVSSGGSIQAVIASAVSGDSIKVATGTYNENLLLDNKRIFLLGGYSSGFTSHDAAANVTKIQGTGSGPVVTLQGQNTSGTIVDGFTISGGTHGILFDKENTWPAARNITISNNIIEHNGTTTENNGGISLYGNGHIITRNVIRFNFANRGGALGGSDSNTISWNLIDSNLAHGDHGGGIQLGGHPVLTHNIIKRNRVGVSSGYGGWGGGGIIYGDGTMSYNIICQNYATPGYGGGFFVDEGGDVNMNHELVFGNFAVSGGGLYVDQGTIQSKLKLFNSTVANNRYSGSEGGGLRITGSIVEIKNCIFWGHDDDIIITTRDNIPSALSMNYTLSKDVFQAGTGNIHIDPMFADTVLNDFHLKSTAGRWSPEANNGNGAWVKDNVNSPAIDAGDPSDDYSAEPSGNGGRINLGYDGGTNEASKSTGANRVIENGAFADYFQFQCIQHRTDKKVRFSFWMPFTQKVLLAVYGPNGQVTASLIERSLASGRYEASWDSKKMPSGTYYGRLWAGDFLMTKPIFVRN